MILDGYLRIPDIPGESRRQGHEDEIAVFGLEFDMEAPADPGTKARRGRVRLGTVRILKHYDRASPYLKRACFQNHFLREAVLTLLRTTGSGEDEDYLIVTLADASIASYAFQPSPDHPGLLEERIAFNFRRIAFDYIGGHEVEFDPRF